MGIKICCFADGIVGQKSLAFLLENYPSDVKLIGLTDKNSLVFEYLRSKNYDVNKCIFWNELKQNEEKIRNLNLDYIILAWWPYIIKKNIIEIPKKGILNFHPSYLPHNAGKHPNFWNLIEERPYGVTIHFIDENIDSGDIVFQRQIKVEWEDNGETLYEKALKTIYELFCDSYPLIREGNYTRKKQLKSDGSFHYGKEMFEKAKLDLNQKCTIREILNLLRAKTFPPYEGCKFQDKGSEYEVTVKIKNITPRRLLEKFRNTYTNKLFHIKSFAKSRCNK